ncbi:MAG: hypothetical protein QM657_11370 [Lacrimispora sp.]|uniref:hypothetical protein n=1 Tax=Lacrimispora sp. TaxID=2719234 RepID=UPI0039E7279F
MPQRLRRKGNQLSLRKFIPIIIMMPSIAIGGLAMYRNHISIVIWGQNIACFLLMSIISCIMYKFGISRNEYKKIIFPSALFLLTLTFVNPGMEGVHRWISIGIIKLNIAMIILPVILIYLWDALQAKGIKFGGVIAFGVILVLLFQPDASQLTGFAIPAMIMISRKANNKAISLFTISTFSLFIVLSWIYLDHLPPVNYVERILSMAADMGLLWLILGVASLAILPMPFLLFPPKNAELISRCIGCYYIIILLSTSFGNFPVPLMGYGISPIIGFYISLTWYLNSKCVKNEV